MFDRHCRQTVRKTDTNLISHHQNSSRLKEKSKTPVVLYTEMQQHLKKIKGNSNTP